MAGADEGKRRYMLEQLAKAKSEKVRRSDLQPWLEQAASRYPG